MALGTSGDHVSALVSFRFPVHLSGFNHFISNIGGGISLLNSALTVAGELLLDGNTATYGAGITLDDICLVSTILNYQVLRAAHSMTLHIEYHMSDTDSQTGFIFPMKRLNCTCELLLS